MGTAVVSDGSEEGQELSLTLGDFAQLLEDLGQHFIRPRWRWQRILRIVVGA